MARMRLQLLLASHSLSSKVWDQLFPGDLLPADLTSWRSNTQDIHIHIHILYHIHIHIHILYHQVRGYVPSLLPLGPAHQALTHWSDPSSPAIPPLTVARGFLKQRGGEGLTGHWGLKDTGISGLQGMYVSLVPAMDEDTHPSAWASP